MHAKTDSEVTSLAPSSPARAPAYFVQSPSHDGKTATSFHSTPATSPPRHSHSSMGPHSRESSSRFSAINHKKGRGGVAEKLVGGPKEIDPIEEEGLLMEYDDERERKRFTKRLYCLGFVLGFFALFSFFALILWGASRSQKPRIAMKSITFQNFIIQAGTDASLVPTDMATLNSTVKFTYRNTGTFFGIHVKSTPFALSYSQLTLATGDMKNFYQTRKSQRTVNVMVIGDKVPLYGGGPILTGTTPAKKSTVPPIPLTLSFMVRSRAYVLGHLVKPKFTIEIQCSVLLDVNKMNKPISLVKSCQHY
ncbi:hypothetical protein LUZ60_015997 [Juncus effusus]|nr:hypothetical protein LUZ60_015997 [Juncus effusus]